VFYANVIGVARTPYRVASLCVCLLFFVFAVRAAGGGFTKISLGEKDLNGKV
jgi:hypothetical protein